MLQRLHSVAKNLKTEFEMVADELEKINRKLQKLSHNNQLTFGIMVSQSLLSNYHTFSSTKNWGNHKILDLILDILKMLSVNEITLTGEFEQINELLQENTPDMDNFAGDIYASLAIDCCSAIGECLDFVNDNDLEHIKTIAYIATQSAEFYITLNEQLQHDMFDFDERIFRNQLMQDEIKFQNDIINSLTSTNKPDKQLFDESNKKAPSMKQTNNVLV